ncbi:MAG TPA: hypothetical protein ENK85_10180 [Saprospiraceae bacterium]|nr:hypothetical protein [Saprospiraceae bacterium]
MKKGAMNNVKNTIGLVLLSILLFACQASDKPAQSDATKTETEAKVTGKNRIEILDFYGTHRCTTCQNIEANTRYTLEKAFSQEVKDGTIVFKTINFDKKENEEIVTEYMAYGTSLFFNVIVDGKENHIDLSEFSFKWGDNQAKYATQLEAKIREQLKKL